MGKDAGDLNLNFAVGCLHNPRFDGVQPKQFGVPKIVASIARKYQPVGISPNFRTVSQRIHLSPLVDEICNRDRSVPIVAVSCREWIDRPSIDVRRMQGLILGAGKVVVVEKIPCLALGPEISTQLETDERLGIGKGTIRIYLPLGDKKTVSRFDHPLYWPAKWDYEELLNDIKMTCLRASVLRPWPHFHSPRLLREIAKAAPPEERRKSDDLSRKNEELGYQILEMEEKLDQQTSKNDTLLKEVDRLKREVQFLRRKDAGEEQIDDEDEDDEDEDESLLTGRYGLAYYRQNHRHPALEFINKDLDPEDRETVFVRLQDLSQGLRPHSRAKTEKVTTVNGVALFEFKINAAKDIWVRFFVAPVRSRRLVLILCGHKKKTNQLEQHEVEAAEAMVKRALESGQL